MSNSTKMFLTRQMVHFCPTPVGVDQTYSDGYSIDKKWEWLSAIELNKDLWCIGWPRPRVKAGLPQNFWWKTQHTTGTQTTKPYRKWNQNSAKFPTCIYFCCNSVEKGKWMTHPSGTRGFSHLLSAALAELDLHLISSQYFGKANWWPCFLNNFWSVWKIKV